LTTWLLKHLLLELVNMGTLKLLVAVQWTADATVPEKNNHRTATVPGHQLEDLLRAVTVPAAPVEVATPLVTTTLAWEEVAAGAPHTGLA
jgi:hypothetical protein